MWKRDTRMVAGCAFWSGIPLRERDRPTKVEYACESRTRVRMEDTRVGVKHACSCRSLKIY